MLNDRQIASLLWVSVILVAVLAKPAGRRSLESVARALLVRKVWPIFVLLALWSLGLVLVGRRIGVWTNDLAADTWFWFFTTAAVLLFNFQKAAREPDFFRRTAKETLGLTLVLGFVSDLYVLSVPVEFVGQAVIALIAAASAMAAHGQNSDHTRKLLNGCLSAIGLMILVLATVSVLANSSPNNVPDLARRLLMPAWMTLGVLPYIYGVALYAAYEFVFNWIDFRTSASFRIRLRAKVAVVARLHAKATYVDKFTLHWATRVRDASSFRAALNVVDEFIFDLARAEREKQDAAARLVRYAGVDGVNHAGQRLDRREFDETANALQWIATCQMGWGRRETGYRADILDVVGDLSSRGLLAGGEVEVRISPNGASWYAWRRTVSGWVFAIGSAGPPPDQWKYDGPEPPTGFPGESPEWGVDTFDKEASPNW